MKKDTKTQTESQLITEKTRKFILETTPKQFVKKRVGRGGKMLDYVETGYIISKLNEVFNYMWSFEVIEDKIGDSQVYVKGKLTAHLSPELSITKVQYGGSNIKKGQDGKPIDIGDDMKAASSDALKKCASLFGIASDIFWPTGKELLDDGAGEAEAAEAESGLEQPLTPRQMAEKREVDEFDILKHECIICHQELTEPVYLYSVNHFKKQLCMVHQQEERSKYAANN